MVRNGNSYILHTRKTHPIAGTVCELDQKLSGDNKDTFEVWSVEDQKLKYAAEAIKMGLMRARRATGGLAELS